MENFDFKDITMVKGPMTPHKHPVQERIEEIKNCAFCGLQVLKSDILKHTETHMETWGGEEQMGEDDKHSEESLDYKHSEESLDDKHSEETLDEISELIDFKTLNCEIVKNEGQKCSFCAELIEMDKMRDHINEHVAQWGNNISVAEKLLGADKDTADEEIEEEFEKSPSEKVVVNKKGKHEIEEVKCSFCDNWVMKEDIQQHIGKHVASWDGKSEKEFAVEQEHSINEEPNPPGTKSDEKPIEKEVNAVKCSFCSEFVSRDDIFQHINNHSLQWENDSEDDAAEKSPVNEKNKCKYCGKYLKYKQELEEHERVHTGEKPLQCTYCAKTFRAKMGLKQHVKSKHTKDATCDRCEIKFSDKRTLTKHLSRVHGQDVGVKCKKCDELFASTISLDNHMKNPCYKHVCTSCGKMFKQKSNLDSHLITHKEAEETKILVCDECGKKYSRQIMLDEHMRTHLNKKEFKCDKCGKGFNRKTGRWDHQRKWCRIK